MKEIATKPASREESLKHLGLGSFDKWEVELHRNEILSGIKRVARVDHIQIAAPEGLSYEMSFEQFSQQRSVGFSKRYTQSIGQLHEHIAIRRQMELLNVIGCEPAARKFYGALLGLQEI